MGLPQVVGLTQPAKLSAAVRKFPRNLPLGILLMLLGTAWFVWNVNIEPIADFSAFKPYMMVGFAAVGVLSRIYVQDFLAVRGLAVVLLLLGKLMVDTGLTASGRIAVRAGDSGVGLRPGRPRHLVYDHAMEIARYSKLGHGQRIAHPAFERRAPGVRGVCARPRPDGVPRDVT